MEDPEVPTDHLHEEMQHHAQHGGSRARWMTGVALSSALIACLAAVCSLLAGHYSNEAMIEQIQSADRWAFYQAKGIKAALLESKIELLEAEGKPVSESDREKKRKYKREQEDIAADAKEKERASGKHLQEHLMFARGVTLFQIAIAIGAISALTSRRMYWFVSLAFGLAGLYFLASGVFMR